MGDDARQDRTSGHAFRGVWEVVRHHPFITGMLLSCTLVGAVLGFAYLSGEWSALRRIAAGAVAGAGTGFLITATKMIG